MSAAMPEPPRTTIGVDVHPRTVRIRIQGDLDAGAAPRLDHVLADAIDEVAARPRSPLTRLTVDLQDVDVLAAAGVTVLLRARDLAEHLGIDYVVCVGPRGRRALAMTGLDESRLAHAETWRPPARDEGGQRTRARTAAGSGPSGSTSTIASSKPASA